jgi:hypothetical protein
MIFIWQKNKQWGLSGALPHTVRLEVTLEGQISAEPAKAAVAAATA